MNATPNAAEQTFVENRFGTVTNKRVVYYGNRGWFSDGSRQDIPLQHVTSVRVDTSRSVAGGVVFGLLGLFAVSSGYGGPVFFGLLLLAYALLLLWGSPFVVVNTAGLDVKAAKGWPWMRDEATAFVEALRGQLFKA